MLGLKAAKWTDLRLETERIPFRVLSNLESISSLPLSVVTVVALDKASGFFSDGITVATQSSRPRPAPPWPGRSRRTSLAVGAPRIAAKKRRVLRREIPQHP